MFDISSSLKYRLFSDERQIDARRLELRGQGSLRFAEIPEDSQGRGCFFKSRSAYGFPVSLNEFSAELSQTSFVFRGCEIIYFLLFSHATLFPLVQLFVL